MTTHTKADPDPIPSSPARNRAAVPPSKTALIEKLLARPRGATMGELIGATNWQNHRLPGSASFTVELPAGSLSAEQVRRQVGAVLTLAPAMHGPGPA